MRYSVPGRKVESAMDRIFKVFSKLRSRNSTDRTIPPLQDTGERVIPEKSTTGFARVNFVRHKAAHLYAARKLRDAGRVLDVGCGTGYGSAILASKGRHVVGIDVSEQAVSRAQASHQRDDLEFTVMSATELDFPTASFDAAYSIQVIEHVEDVKRHLSEVVRVLRPGGRFVVATPNRLTYSPNGLQNPFHIREYDVRELRALLAAYFEKVEIVGLHAGLDLAFRPEAAKNEFSARVTALQSALSDAPEELRQFMDEWLVEDSFEGFRPGAVGPHSFPISSKSIDTSLDLLASCRKA